MRSMTPTQHAELNRFLSSNDTAGAVQYLASIGEPVAVLAQSMNQRYGTSFADFAAMARNTAVT